MSTPQQSSFTAKLYTYLPILEKVAIAIFALGLILRYMNVNGDTLIQISLSTLAAVFFLSAYKPVTIESEEGEKLGFKDLLGQTILPKLLGISCAVGIIGIQFYMLGLKGFEVMVMMGGIVTLMALVVMGGLYAIGTKNLESAFPMVLRAIPIMIFNIYVFIQHGGLETFK
ncbi:hypothetical protein BH10BAC4_BH10BAC4_02680 [soil metagenome]